MNQTQINAFFGFSALVFWFCFGIKPKLEREFSFSAAIKLWRPWKKRNTRGCKWDGSRRLSVSSIIARDAFPMPCEHFNSFGKTGFLVQSAGGQIKTPTADFNLLRIYSLTKHDIFIYLQTFRRFINHLRTATTLRREVQSTAMANDKIWSFLGNWWSCSSFETSSVENN